MKKTQTAKLLIGLLATFGMETRAEPIPNFSQTTEPATSSVAVSLEPQLFIDDYLIAEATDLVRTTHSPVRALDHPILGWREGTTQPYVTVLHDPQTKRFRMWYNKNLDRTGTIAYAESEDGLQWKTPSLGILGDNNELIHTGKYGSGFGVSVIDDGPDANPPEQRYKIAWFGKDKRGSHDQLGTCVSFSPDGLHWKSFPGNPILRDFRVYKDLNDRRRASAASDIVDVFRDPYRDRYVAFIKTVALPEDGYTTAPKAGQVIRRLVSQSVSNDFMKWERPWRMVVPEPRDPGMLEFYGVGGTFARGGLLIGFVRMLHDDYSADKGGPVEGIGYTTLITSRDGKHWQRHDDVFFDRDPNPDAWDHAFTWVGCAVPVGDELYLYYGGYKQGHKIERLKERQLGLARMTRDRFVSRDAADGRTGVLKTVTLQLPKDATRLVLNADSSRGEIRVRILDAQTGRTLPGYDWMDCQPVAADGIELPVAWQTVQRLPEQENSPTVQLEFELKKAALYGFQFAR